MTALRSISIDVAEGEAVSIVGPDGAGKSTTLNTIAGLVRPSRGRVLLTEQPIAGKAPEQIVRMGSARSPRGDVSSVLSRSLRTCNSA